MSRLGDEFGDLAGYEPEEALRLVMGMHKDMAEENAKLRQRTRKDDDEPQKPRPDLQKLRSEDMDEAARALESYVNDAVEARLGDERKRGLPAAREAAKQAAASEIAKIGGDFSEYAKELEESIKALPAEQQTDPAVWQQAYVLMHGAKALMSKKAHLEQPEEEFDVNQRPRRPFAESPTPPKRQETSGYEDPQERFERMQWERQLGTPISKEEWVEFRDNINTIEDYERFLAKQEQKKKGR